MGLADKKRDILVSIQGKSASIYRKDVALLIAGELPPGWQAVPSSDETFVAFNKNTNTYYKEFLPRNVFEKLKAFLRGSRCSRARRQAELLTQKGFNTPEILCWGYGKSSEFFFTQGVTGEGFSTFMCRHFKPPLDQDKLIQKRLLLCEVGELIGNLHKNGIAHGDLRSNNLLVEKDSSAFNFYFIDNESNKYKYILRKKQVIKNLVQFTLVSSHLLSRTDILRFFKSYSNIYSRYARDKQFLSLVMQKRQKRLNHLTLKSIRLHNSQKTKIISTKSLFGKYITDSPVDKLLKTNIPIEEILKNKTKVLKKDKSITVALLQVEKEDIIVKRFAEKNFLQQIEIKVGRSKAKHLWKMSLALKELNIPTPQPYGFLVERDTIKGSKNYFFCKALKQHKTLNTVAGQHPNFEEWLTPIFLHNIVKSLAMMHSNGINHGDTKWKNIIVDEHTHDFWWIDLDSTHFRRGFMNRWFLKDLARFDVEFQEKNISKSFSLEFIRFYANCRNIDPEKLKKLIEPYKTKILIRHSKKCILPKP